MYIQSLEKNHNTQLLPTTLEDATSNNIYDYWLRQTDIPDIARVHYGYSNGELEVVGDRTHLSSVLDNYRNGNNVSPLTIIINLGRDHDIVHSGQSGMHWVSVVCYRVNDQYHGYYTDSYGYNITDSLDRVFINHNIFIHSISINQQSDGFNCGLFALANANVIRRMLASNNNPTSMDLPIMGAEALIELRQRITSQLHQDYERTLNIHHYNIAVQDRAIPDDYYNNAYQRLESCMQAVAILYILSHNTKHKRSIVNDKLKINGREFLECTDNLNTNITYFQLIMLLHKFHIVDDNSCDEVNKFFKLSNGGDIISNIHATDIQNPDWHAISRTPLPTTVDTYILSRTTTKYPLLRIRYGDDIISTTQSSNNQEDSQSLWKSIKDILVRIEDNFQRYYPNSDARKKRIVEYKVDNEEHVLEESKLTTQALEDSNHHKHRHHHGEWHKRAVHQIDKKHKEEHQRERRDLEDTLKNNDNKQLNDKLVATQEKHVRSDTDSRYAAVQHVIGTRYTIEQDASKFIDSKGSPVVKSVPNQLLVDWQGNLLLGYLLFGKKYGGAKCEMPQDVVNDPRDLEYAQRLAYVIVK